MTSSWLPQARPAAAQPPFITRKPVRITTTVSWATYQSLIGKSDFEGRSLSNLMAFVLESYVKSPQGSLGQRPL